MNFNATLIGQTISFAIFVWFTMKFVWPLLLKQMQDREAKIADGLAAAEKGQEALVQAQQRHTELLEEGKQQAAEIIARAQRRGDEIIEEARTLGKSEGERLVQSAHAEIEQQWGHAREQLRQDVALLALAGAEQILMREVDRKAHNEILEKVGAGL